MGEAVGKVPQLRYVKYQLDRRGHQSYWYFRRNGRMWRLPGIPHSPEFMEAYYLREAETDPKKAEPPSDPIKPVPGSLKAVAIEYMRGPEWRNLKPASQRLYKHVLDPMVKKRGHKPIALIERKHIKQWREEKADTPGMANMLVKVVRVLLAYAVDSGYRKDNPALHIKPFKLGEHRAWTHDELARFEVRWPPGSMQRRAYALARYTGQRVGDVAGMTRAHRRGDGIWVKQQKTGAELLICEHSALTAELACGDQANMSLLTKANGASFDGESLSPWFAAAIDDAGLSDDCVMHGLRKVAARDLAEAGCSLHEIMSVTGHESLSEVARYTKSANQQRMAQLAIAKLEQNKKRTTSGKRHSGGSGKQKPRH